MKTYKFGLTVGDRLNVGSLFPAEAGMLALATMRDISEKVRLTREERDYYELRDINECPHCKRPQSIKWDPDKEPVEKEFEFTSHEMRFLQLRIRILDDEERLQLPVLGLVDKVMETTVPKIDEPTLTSPKGG